MSNLFSNIFLFAELAFPRGPGFYLSPFKLLAVVLVYFGWLAVCRWVDEDVQARNLPRPMWNSIVFAGGALGLLFAWLLPIFALAFLVLLACAASPALAYVYRRNQLVTEDDRVLTPEHFATLLQRYLKVDVKQKAKKERDESNIPVQFISKTSDSAVGTAEDDRAARAAGSKGYKAARRMVYEAILARATDIHMEPTKDEMSVRFRIDGMMQATAPFSRLMGDSVLNIFKVLANIDITEKRKSQDGSFGARVEGRTVDFRVNTAGSVAGEKMVLRILDNSQQIIRLDQLGMRADLREQIQRIVTQPHGMFICCGPTGAGKTTTLYACLNEIDRFQSNVITIENPVEYKLEHATQIEINPKAGKTFASELRGILRQDPDVILVGEIRDQETAEVACQAAQTGHMVLTTLHANDTVTALGRLIDLGVQPFMLANAISAILGQRLMRVLCKECKVRYKPPADLIKKFGLPGEKIKHFHRPPEPGDPHENGEPDECENCGGKGYHGRTGIFELLVLTDKIRDMIRENPNLTAIKEEAVRNGMRFLQVDGLYQVIDGVSSVQELTRVTK